MKSYKAFIVYILLEYALAHGQETRTSARVESLSLNEESVTVVHLSPGYATAVRMPREISCGVVGDPENFRPEPSKSEARLVFLKPVTTNPAESNALITMRTGQEVSLHLLSSGLVTTEGPRVD